MDARSIARLHAAGRVVLGAGLALAPGLVAGAWVGGVADKRPGQALALGLGARDVGIGLGALRAIGAGRGARPWVRAGILADAADLAGTLRARDELPPGAFPGVGVLAAGSMLLGAWLQATLD